MGGDDNDLLLELDLTGVDAKTLLEPVSNDSGIAIEAHAEDRFSERDSKASVLYFDIETVPDFDRSKLFDDVPSLMQPQVETPDRDMIDIDVAVSKSIADIERIIKRNPSREWLQTLKLAEAAAKKPRTGVFEAIERAMKSKIVHLDHNEAVIKKCSVTPEYCRIAAVGFIIEDGEPSLLINSNRDLDGERWMLEQFWGRYRNSQCVVGFNCLHFDLPVLLVRSAILRVPAPQINLWRPWDNKIAIVDLMRQRFGTGPAIGMKKLAKAYGLPIPVENTDGSAVMTLWNMAKFDELADYLSSDLQVTRSLHRFYMGYLS